MDLKLVNMTPFRTKVEGETLKIVFAYQYIQINKDGEIFNFIPIEGREIIFDFKYQHIKNLDDVFVFYRLNRFISLPLYKLATLCEGFEESVYQISKKIKSGCGEEIESLVKEIEYFNIQREIDRHLELRDFETCRKLVELCKQTSMVYQ